MAKRCNICDQQPCMGGKGPGSCYSGKRGTRDEQKTASSRRRAPLWRGDISKLHRGDKVALIGDLDAKNARKTVQDRNSTIESGPKRHYEVGPDPDNLGKSVVYMIIDE